MKPLKIALLQIAPGDTLEENLEKGLCSCREAKRRGADIALFPEMWSNGYRIYGRPGEQRRPSPPEAALSAPSRSLPGSWKWPSPSPCWSAMRAPPAIP